MIDEFVASVLKNDPVGECDFIRGMAINNSADLTSSCAGFDYQFVVVSKDRAHVLIKHISTVSEHGVSPIGLPTSTNLIEGANCVGMLDETVICACEYDIDFPADYEWLSIKSAFLGLNPKDRSAVSYVIQRYSWLQEYRFCSYCGHMLNTVSIQTQWDSKRCSQCDKIYYPPVHPCVLVGVIGAEGVLLVRAHHYEQGRFSVIAGFVEAGESAEECVRREVEEEVGVKLGRMSYVASQSWPFPRQLMLGYLAMLHNDYIGSELRLQASELSEGCWFTPDNLPSLPQRGTLSRRLIDLSLRYWRESFG